MSPQSHRVLFAMAVSAVFCTTALAAPPQPPQESGSSKASKPAKKKSQPVKAPKAKAPAEATQEAKPTDTTAKPTKVDPVPPLLENLKSESIIVAAGAARSLGAIFSPGGRDINDAPEVAEALLKALKSLRGAPLRREAATALGRARAKQAVEPLTAALSDEDVTVSIAAAEALADVLPLDEARKFLIEKGKSTESEHVRTAVYVALAPIAKVEDSEFLAAGLTSDNWRIQQAAVRGLERTVRAGAELPSETYDGVAGVLGADTINASRQAVYFLSNIRNEECIRAAIKAADPRGDDTEADSSWRTRVNALRALDRMGWPTLQQALPVVIRNLGDRTANVKNLARHILNELRKEKFVTRESLFPILLKELEAAEPLRLRAGIMQEMGRDVPRQYASRVAQVAAKTLTEAGSEKQHWPARAAAISLLGASGYTAVIEEVAAACAADVSNVRQAAGRSLSELAPLCTVEQRTAVVPILRPVLVTPHDWRKTAIAARAAGYYPSTELVAPLVKLLGHSVLNVKEAAADSLVRYIQTGDEKLIVPIESGTLEAVAADDLAWQFGAEVLGALKTPKAVPHLTKILLSGHWRAQAAAGEAAAKIAGAAEVKDKDLRAALIRAAQSDIVQVYTAANKALRQLSQ